MTWTGATWINHGGEQIADDPTLASRLIRKGLLLEPKAAVGWFNLGLSYHQERKIEASIRAYKHALLQQEAPQEAIQRNLWQDLLLIERWREGWQLMEERSLPNRFKNFALSLGPSWTGTHDPIGLDQGLLVLSEQGLGDTLMFARFAVQLQRQGFRIKLLCQAGLVDLLQTCSELTHVEALRKPMPSDLGWRWVPLMSLPSRLPWLHPPWPSAIDWLSTNSECFVKRQQRWRELLKLKPDHKLIGLHWQGNPNHEGSLYSRHRSIPLQAWEGLGATKDDGIEFVALQKGAGLEQWSRLSKLPYVAGQEQFNSNLSMLDTAAVMSLCQAVISTDSCVVHLGGSLGVPTWVALRCTPDWRWGLDGNLTPWYSTLRLFRQPVHNDWSSVVQSIGVQLK